MKKLILAASCICFLTGCPSGPVITMTPVNLADYTFETTPNSLDKVGYVFAVNDKSVQIPVAILDVQNVQDGTVTVASSSRTRDVTFGAILKFLGLEKVNVSGDLSIDNNKKIKTTFKLEKPTLSRSLLLDWDSALALKKDKIKDAITNNHLENARLYLIIEVIKSTKLTYEFDKANVGSAALNANFSEAATTVGANAKWNNTNSQSLDFDLGGPQTVFYKIVEVNVLSSIGGDFNVKKGNDVHASELIYDKKQ